MFQRRSCAKTYWCQCLIGRNVILLKLVLGIQVHNLAKSTERLKGLSTDACRLELELHQQRIYVLCNWPVFVLCLYFSTNLQTFAIAVSFSDNSIQYLVFDKRAHFGFLSSAAFSRFWISDRFNDLSDFVLNSELILASFSLILGLFQLFLFKLFLSWFRSFNGGCLLSGGILRWTPLSLFAAKFIDLLSDLLQLTFAPQFFNVLLGQELSPPSLYFNNML